MKHFIRFAAVLAIALSVLPMPAPALAYVQPPLEYYHSLFFNTGSRLCLQPTYEAPINGLSIVQQPCNSNNLYQKWSFWAIRLDYQKPGIYQIRNSGSGQCLDDRDGASADGSPVQQWTCNFDSTTMQWRLEDVGASNSYQFRNMRTGKCLDVRAGSLAPGAALQIYRCTSTATSHNAAQLFWWKSTTLKDGY
jgi:hypothetical protein